MNIDTIKDGIVIDHITAGNGMEVYNYLRLDTLDCSVAVIRNAKSTKTDKKDIVKIDAPIDINLDVLGYLDPEITVNYIRDGSVIEKKHLALPHELKNVLFCKNPRCITSCEQELDHIFKLTDSKSRTYRCIYCETRGK
ncbi:MAG: aspartate carbamoyltransferase regulatory subunit [Oscillospiraceae bacterium]